MEALQGNFQLYMNKLWITFAGVLGVSAEEAEDLLGRFRGLLEIPLDSSFSINFGDGFLRKKRGERNQKKDVVLQHCHVITHLLRRSYAIAITRRSRTRIVVIDLDNKGPERAADLAHRYRAIVAVLGEPSVAIRSSKSGGLHLIYFLTEWQFDDELREMVEEALNKVGIVLDDGIVELYPYGHRVIRVPFGPGSCLLDLSTLKPLYVTGSGEKGIEIDLRRSILALERVAKTRRYKIEDLVRKKPSWTRTGWRSPEKNVLPARSTSGKVAKRPGLSNPRLPKMGSPEWMKLIAACDKGVSAYHRRYLEHRLRILDLYRRRGFSVDEALAIHEKWLREGTHRSHDLEADREGTIRTMMRDTKKKLAHLEKTTRMRRSGSARACTSFSSSFPSSSKTKFRIPYTPARPHLSNAAHQAEKRGVGWRVFLVGFVKGEDQQLVGALKTRDPRRREWLTRHLLTLIGLLRWILIRTKGKRIVGIDGETFRAITGGRPAPGATRFETRSGRALVVNGHSTRALREAAEQLGLIRLQLPAIVGVRSNVYEILIPAAAVASGRAG